MPPKQPFAPDPAHPCAGSQCGMDLQFSPGAAGMTGKFSGSYDLIGRLKDEPKDTVDMDNRSATKKLDPVAAKKIKAATCPNRDTRLEFDSAVHPPECRCCAKASFADPGPNRDITSLGVLPCSRTERAAKNSMFKIPFSTAARVILTASTGSILALAT